MDKSLLMNVLKVVIEGRQSELNNIPFNAREEILKFAIKEKLVDGLRSTKDSVVGDPRITLKGLDYFNSNKKSTKFYETLKEIRDWIPGY